MRRMIPPLMLFATVACQPTADQETQTTEDQQTAPAPEPQRAPAQPVLDTVQTSKGAIVVPGEAFLDGRDMEANPPLTVMNINVWDAVPRRRVVCRLSHGTKVALTAVRRSSGENRYYFRLRGQGCDGWIPETFLSINAQRPVGDRM